MSSEPSNDANRRPHHGVTTFTYDDQGRLRSVRDEMPTSRYDWPSGKLVVPEPSAGDPPPALTPPQPVLRHTFEFRLTGSETQEQCLPLASGLRPAELLLATQAVRAYLTRTGEQAATSAIGGVEVGAELRAGGIVCRASLSDFGPGDLVVVQVEVALFKRGE